MYRCDPIVFTGPTRKFVELLTPMLLSNRFKTAGKNKDRSVMCMDKNKQEISTPKPDQVERPIPAKIYPAIDTDLARDNLENDLPAADLEDL